MSDVAAVIAPIALAHMVGDYLIQSDWMSAACWAVMLLAVVCAVLTIKSAAGRDP